MPFCQDELGSLAQFQPPVIGHRGLAAVAPENTLAGFCRAADVGLHWVEFDVKLSADNVPVVIHDHLLDRTTSGQGDVAALDVAQLQQLDAGRWFAEEFAGESVPCLSEVLALCLMQGLAVNIELKPNPGQDVATVERVVDVIAEHWPMSAPLPLLSSFSTRCIEAAQRLAPALPRGLLVANMEDTMEEDEGIDWLMHQLAQWQCQALHCSEQVLSDALIARVKQSGYLLLVYTVNSAETALRLLASGVDAIFSDYPLHQSLLPMHLGRSA